MIKSLKTENYCIIPCRSGSKRIKNKNKKYFAGQRMFEMAIDRAKESGLFKDIIISTNDEEIFSISQKKGICSFFRSEQNSTDNSTTISAIKESVNWLIKEKKIIYDNFFEIAICCLYPCTPFVKKSFLTDSYDLLFKYKNKFVYPVIQYSHPFERRMQMNEKNILSFEEPDKVNKRTQDCEKYYFDAGQFYWGFIPNWLESSQIHDNAYGYDLSEEILYDIDTLAEFNNAETIYKSLHKKVI